jgi:hypothetical protein
MHATASLFPQKIDNFDESSPHCYPAHIRVTETGAIFYMRASIEIRPVSMPYFIVRNTLDRHIRDHEYDRRCHFDAMNTYDLVDPVAGLPVLREFSPVLHKQEMVSPRAS